MSWQPSIPASVTTTPDTDAPNLFCPACQQLLVYRQTVFNGRSPRERWDYFACQTCGLYEYRHRTRTLRSTAQLPFRLP